KPSPRPLTKSSPGPTAVAPSRNTLPDPPFARRLGPVRGHPLLRTGAPHWPWSRPQRRRSVSGVGRLGLYRQGQPGVAEPGTPAVRLVALLRDRPSRVGPPGNVLEDQGGSPSGPHAGRPSADGAHTRPAALACWATAVGSAAGRQAGGGHGRWW